MTEEWRAIAGYEGLYEVSSLGRVRSLPRVVQYGGSRIGTSASLPGGVLVPFGKLYPVVKLARDGRKTPRNIHELVLETFVGPRPKGFVACHCDGENSNNAVTNLRWDSVQENNLDIIRHGRHTNANKTHCPRGHEYSPENTYRPPSRPGWRYCRACQPLKKRNRIDALAVAS